MVHNGAHILPQKLLINKTCHDPTIEIIEFTNNQATPIHNKKR